MIELRQILCPVDFSEISKRALDHAVALGRWYGSTVTVLNVHSVVPVAPVAPEILPTYVLTEQDRDELLRTVKQFALSEAGSEVPLRFELAEGNAATEILARASALSTDLIVVGTHGRSGFERFLLGSVAERVLRKATCPVLTVPPSAADAMSPPMFKRILCAIDFSECSMRALDFAVSLAQEADAALIVTHVFDLEGTLPDEWRATLTPPSIRAELKKLEDERRHRLTRAVAPEVCMHCTVETVMASGVPHQEILRLAEQRHSDVIVIGVQGRNAADLMFFGSTANRVVRQAACPVLTIRMR